MRFSDIQNCIKENYQANIKNIARDALMLLKIQGHDKVLLTQIEQEFADRGMKISTLELINLLKDDPLVKDVNQHEVTFSQDMPNNDSASMVGQPNPNKEKMDDEIIDNLAKGALNKRMKQ